jgi:hypothetical protein
MGKKKSKGVYYLVLDEAKKILSRHQSLRSAKKGLKYPVKQAHFNKALTASTKLFIKVVTATKEILYKFCFEVAKDSKRSSKNSKKDSKGKINFHYHLETV